MALLAMFGMDWERHWVLLGLLALPLLFLAVRAYWNWRTKALAAWGQSAARWLPTTTPKRFWWTNGLLLTAIGCLFLALANPVWQGKSAPQKQNACDVFIAMDISRSMLANDLRPNRLVQARIFAQDLLKALSGNRVGLIFFAGDAFLSVPLSTDHPTVASLIAEADPNAFSAQGTAIGSAVELARKSFDPEGGGRALILITDGEDHEEGHIEAIETAYNEDGLITYAVGVGTTQGGNIPMYSGGAPLRVHENKVVLTALNQEALKDMAKAGGSGLPPMLVSDKDNTVRQLADDINQLYKKEVAVRNAATRSSGYQWLVLPALLILGGLLLQRPRLKK